MKSSWLQRIAGEYRERPTFSIITGNFNSRAKLHRTFDSLVDQLSDAEYIVVDGASTDESLLVAQAMANVSAGRVRLLSEPDKGVYDAMNKGIQLARGRYILFLGAGDELLPGSLGKVSKWLPEHDGAMVYGDVQWEGRTYDGKFTKRKLCERNICHQAIFYGRETFNRIGSYNLDYHAYADWELNLRCFGSRQIAVKYVPVTVSLFEPGGFSANGDSVFERRKCELIRSHLGCVTYLRYRWPYFKSHAKYKMSMMLRSSVQHG